MEENKRTAQLGRDNDQQQSNAVGYSLKSRVALVTGATGGLGRAITAELRERGADVYGADIAGEGVFQVDLAAASGSRDMIAHVLAIAGRLDILVLNAGCQIVAPIDQFPELNGNVSEL